MDDEWYCGGTIISDDYIMTAGIGLNFIQTFMKGDHGVDGA